MKFVFIVCKVKSEIVCMCVCSFSTQCPEGKIYFFIYIYLHHISISILYFKPLTLILNRWFHSHLNGLDAQRILLDEGIEGSFLVRKSYSRIGQFVLSVR